MGLNQEIIAKLNQPLDPSRVKTREGPGGKTLSYVEGHDCVATANEIFGVGNWGYAVKEIQCIGFGKVKARDPNDPDEFIDEERMMYYAVVELCIANCAPITEAGFGSTRGDRPEHHEMAVKGAVTDGLKRCLKNYGEQFGLGLYGEGGVPAISIPDDLGSMPCPGKKHQGKTLAEVYGEDSEYLGWIADNWREDDIREAVSRFLEQQTQPEEELITLPSGGTIPANQKITAGWVKALTDLSIEAGWDKTGTHLKNHLKKHYGLTSVAELTFKDAMPLREHLEGLKAEQPREEEPEAPELILDEAILKQAAKAGFGEDDAGILVAEKMGDAPLTPECYQAFFNYFNALASGTKKDIVDRVLDAGLERLKEAEN